MGHDTALSLILLLISAPSLLGSIGFLAHAGVCGWPNPLDIGFLLLSSTAAWLLWPAASLMGLAGAAFPSGYMITGAILGHAQALINPYLYGVRWRHTVLQISRRRPDPALE